MFVWKGSIFLILHEITEGVKVTLTIRSSMNNVSSQLDEKIDKIIVSFILTKDSCANVMQQPSTAHSETFDDQLSRSPSNNNFEEQETNSFLLSLQNKVYIMTIVRSALIQKYE